MKEEEKQKIEEVREIIAPRRVAIFRDQSLQINKNNGQVSIKIPKSMAERAGLNKSTIAHIVLEPNQGTFEEAVKSDLVIYFNEEKTNEKKKEANKGQSKNNN
ncbi:MAG: hypothetical protein WCX73_05340 [Candidatus Pacearchaeota archaeon]|jgi:hypothetical protein